jgi:CelD/BcsL family acetyltransferase involved in cellulose biosynthesis
MIRALVVTDGESLISIAPFFVVRSGFGFYRYEPAAPQLHGVEPLCVAGREVEASEAIAVALATSDPTPDIVSLDWIPAVSPFPHMLRSAWPRPRPAIVEERTFVAPRVELTGRDFDQWLGERSKHFRKLFRSALRKLEAAGFEHRVLTAPSDVLERLPQQQRLYERRRAARGGSGPPFNASFMSMVTEAVATSRTGRVRLATLERPGEIIASHLVISGGGESSVWIGGFEEEWAHLSPGRVNLALCVQDSKRGGDAIMDLGPGDETYKFWLTDDAVMLQSCVLSRRGLRPFHTPAQLLPFGTRQAAARLVGRFRKSA